ncbi:cyclase family protein [Salinadaptatus halalkaliphilus]|uniref:cyclase family protein n=1 Tax=Salinadaptatus halalkaliphilus TaxID=2419781 RepID=UPI001FE6ECFA|nr:cyclase family protein [Salinadaptatus halalkaliphilus]
MYNQHGSLRRRSSSGRHERHKDLRSTADAQGTDLEERDILLIRTGAVARLQDPGAEWDPLNEPGLRFSEELVWWLYEMDIPMIGPDNLAVEKVNQEIDGTEYVIPLHGVTLRDLGVYLNEILWLDDLAASCATDGIYEVLYTAAPLHMERATGAPINSLVLKAH